MSPDKAFLIILDGYGISADPGASAISKAYKPVLDSLFNQWPHATLHADGEYVGLPPGQFGNSEVGHLNIGAGRIVWQELSRIDRAIKDHTFFENDVLLQSLERASKQGTLHVMGLLSDGGVHSHIEHLKAIITLAKQQGITRLCLHAFMDGRDTSPTSGVSYLEEIQTEMKRTGLGELSTVVGRYYAMDRDHRWERTELAYRALTLSIDAHPSDFITTDDFVTTVKGQYEKGITDEFLPPILPVTPQNSRIHKGDSVLFFNIRGDRTRQIIKALFGYPDIPFHPENLKLDFTCFTSYDEQFLPHVHIAFPPVDLSNTLGEVVSRHGLKQIRIAETEKYPHVTYFFNGGKEQPLPGEERILIPSPKVATYDLQPEMSAPEVADALLPKIKEAEASLVVLNFANADMVGHTGDMNAAIKAVEAVDKELGRLVPVALEHGYQILIIADHGNADCMIQPDGSPHTAHTTAPVPVLLVGRTDVSQLRDGILADVAPTLLRILGISQPAEMTGKPLF